MGQHFEDVDELERAYPMWQRRAERDACGTGFVADLGGRASHEVLREALYAVSNLAHRGAVDADRKTGDGAGVMFGLPQLFFCEEYARLSGEDPGARRAAVGVFFLPEAGTRAYPQAKALVERELERRGLTSWAWRHVPMHTEVLGAKARQTLPDIEHLILMVDPWTDIHTVERRLWALRRTIEQAASAEDLPLYVASMSCRTIVYKGLMIAPMLADVFVDLGRESIETSFAVFHQRYSTNTLPTWNLAQPFRRVAHNGEINTLDGNHFWAEVRSAQRRASVWRDDEGRGQRWPLLPEGASDSACLDAALELLTLSGRSLPHAMAMLVPAAQDTDPQADPDLAAFYDYHACVTEPWDGPAAVVFADGDIVGASLDRNGLRPLRYKLMREGMIVVGSEAGVLDLPEARVQARGRLGPGQMLAVDLVRGRLHGDEAIKRTLSRTRPWRAWIERGLGRLKPAPEPAAQIAQLGDRGRLERAALQNVFGYSAEERRFLFEPMAREGDEPIGSMGDDTPLAVLSRQPRLVCTYFKQRFAQVTNPPIDPIREAASMDLRVVLGARPDWLEEIPEHAEKLMLSGPVLTRAELAGVEAHFEGRAARLDAVWSVEQGPAGLRPALRQLCERAGRAVDEGAEVLILSDLGVDAHMAPMPMLLVVGAVNHYLRRVGKRHQASLVVESGEPREVHHIATLIGYGAAAVQPWLAEWTIADEIAGEDEECAPLIERWRAVLRKGLLKVMAKMGISVLRGYHGAQLFEAVGLGDEVIRACFTGTPSQVGGVGFERLGAEALARHARGTTHERAGRLDDQGHFRFRRSGELHAWSPKMLRAIKLMQRAEDPAPHYAEYVAAAHGRDPISLRDLMEWAPPGEPVPLEQVEPARAIATRFTSAAMSLGSLSPETHHTLAVAMNRLGGKSNTGEGGEDPRYYDEGPAEAIAKIKQVASGRFGVTTEYLMRAEEIEIKMAQGSKPGEGGQIPGHKVTGLIARLRRSVPGVALISPPPHHDIYSIEDLAQLIWDLRQVNPRARICVKLVAEAGVGTIAAGVAKAGADTILISGHDGGTGASPLSSIKNAGLALGAGLSEAQQVLMLNGLRGRVLLRTDGGLRTGRDVVIAALLGAEEYNFGTAALVALGCRTCASATRTPARSASPPSARICAQRFDGDADQLVAFLLAVAERGARAPGRAGRALARRGHRPGRALRRRALPDHPKAASVDLSALLPAPGGVPRRHDPTLSAPREPTLNDRIALEVSEAIECGVPVRARYKVRNTDRTVGARAAGKIAARWGLEGLPEATIRLDF